MLVEILTLVLLIPLSLVQDLISERSILQKEVVTETTSKWGGKIAFQGPILKTLYTDPLTKKNRMDKIDLERMAWAFFGFLIPAVRCNLAKKRQGFPLPSGLKSQSFV